MAGGDRGGPRRRGRHAGGLDRIRSDHRRALDRDREPQQAGVRGHARCVAGRASDGVACSRWSIGGVESEHHGSHARDSAGFLEREYPYRASGRAIVREDSSRDSSTGGVGEAGRSWPVDGVGKAGRCSPVAGVGVDAAGVDGSELDSSGFDSSGLDSSGFDSSGFDSSGLSACDYPSLGFSNLGFSGRNFSGLGFSGDKVFASSISESCRGGAIRAQRGGRSPCNRKRPAAIE